MFDCMLNLLKEQMYIFIGNLWEIEHLFFIYLNILPNETLLYYYVYSVTMIFFFQNYMRWSKTFKIAGNVTPQKIHCQTI